ncbi:hypothetical protein DICSQDRAFT_129424 [Dichomitus squalens LYAD-421 SS1]|uniref:SAP domain-containing protein n=1 Tax=Dichomitus squalens (strain LYAD-421) TaxID=732165 RepID=R7SNK0_DICSQ|nr:uncharacterized protein DICSQDRAFT_129424 [Dichomitus squalens LYAD-421 SS1]EJF57518.1 hypothetical protein DICSQDRAFT_129424 [Dichomitus squalens LYAD-421 SS1]
MATTAFDKTALQTMKRGALHKLAKESGVRAVGTNHEIIDRLLSLQATTSSDRIGAPDERHVLVDVKNKADSEDVPQKAIAVIPSKDTAIRRRQATQGRDTFNDAEKSGIEESPRRKYFLAVLAHLEAAQTLAVLHDHARNRSESAPSHGVSERKTGGKRKASEAEPDSSQPRPRKRARASKAVETKSQREGGCSYIVPIEKLPVGQWRPGNNAERHHARFLN